jgi:NAD+ synthase (glutamine-hydrolysing)
MRGIMKIALCQLNSVMGDIAGNLGRIAQALEQTGAEKPDLLVFPELFLMGYPPRDLLEQSWFVQRAQQALQELCTLSRSYPESGLLVGCALPHSQIGIGLHNAVVLIYNGEVLFQQNKSLLPSYDVFDEMRYFDPAQAVALCPFKGEHLGITICEDAWNHPDMGPRRRYQRDPVGELARAGATVLINVASSPFHLGKENLRMEIVRRHAREHRLPLVFVNQVGGNDELVFDGGSMVVDEEGALIHWSPCFEQSCATVTLGTAQPAIAVPQNDTIAQVHDALVLGVRDYVHKCGFSGALLGLSGGIDSAVTAVIAAHALGAQNVLGVTMPSRYSSAGSVDDSRILAQNLGIEFKNIAIEPIFNPLLEQLVPHFGGRAPDATEENMQARIRGNVLMALSNKLGKLLLSTGNKSEMAVGYCTLYGDMNGGLSVISDLPKIMVYALARHINRDAEVIPLATIEKAPSAELRPDQKDQDSLPPYEVLDAILELLIEQGKSGSEIVAAGFDSATVGWIIRAIKLNEYKRRQAAPGLKVTPKAFGCGRRFPIAARYERS